MLSGSSNEEGEVVVGVRGCDGLRGGGWKTLRPSTSALAPPPRGAGACRDGTKDGETGGKHKYTRIHTSSGEGGNKAGKTLQSLAHRQQSHLQ